MERWYGRLRRAAMAVAMLSLVALGGAGALPARPVTGPDLAWQQAVLSGRTLPAGFSRHAVPEAAARAPLAPTSSYDPNRVADKFAEYQAALALPVTNSDRRWQDVGPRGVDNPDGYIGSAEQFQRIAGMTSALTVDPADATGKTVYAGNMGGLWRSTDGGDNWANLSDGKLPTAAVGAIALDPAHPGDIYVGTGITYLTLSGDAYGTGLFVSHDGGATFTRPSPNVSGWAVNVIRVTPAAVLIGTNHGLYRSTDRGATVAVVDLPDNAAGTGPASGPYANWISDIAVRPGHDTEVTVAVGFALGKKKLADQTVSSPGNGLYRSTSSGAPGSFTRMDVSGLVSPESSTDPIGRISLAYGQTAAETATGVLWAFVSDAGLAAGGTEFGDRVPNQGATKLNGLFRSQDDGATWTVKATPTSLLTAPNSTLTGQAPLGYAPGVQAYYELWVATDPQNADQVYFGLEEAYQTIANAGNTPGLALVDVMERYADVCGFFSIVPNVTNGAACPAQTPLYGGFTTHPDQHAVAIARTAGGVRVYSANDGGVFRQDSHAVPTGGRLDNDSWTPANTLATLEPWHVAMLPSGEILAALQDNGVSLNGTDRKGVQVGLGDGYWALPTADSNIFYIGVAGGLLFVTKDHGHNFLEIQPNLTAPQFTSPIVVDPTDPMHLVAAAQNIEESLKGPNTTTTADNAATGTIVSTDWTSSFDAGASPTPGVSWTATALDVRGPVSYAALCGRCGVGTTAAFNEVHAAVETNMKPGCTPAKGSSACWHIAASKGLPPATIQRLIIDPADNKTIYVSVFERQFLGYPAATVPGRVYVSHDGGENFSDLTGNLPKGSVWGLVQHAGQLIAATDMGMFTAPQGTTSWSRLSTGLPAVQMRDAWLDPTGRYLLVSAYGRGVWMLDFGAASAGGTNSPGVTASSLPNTSTGPGLAAVGLPLLTTVALITALLPRRRTETTQRSPNLTR